jgi:squalene-hopene/tetraprenyl-beta-curcumene cyclase
MREAREAILKHGGAQKANVFTRFLLAMFGELPWRATPSIPVELIFLPRWFPIHLSKMSYWARTVVVPLLVLAAVRPRARNPRNVRIPELFTNAAATAPGRAAHQNKAWAAFFGALDNTLKLIDSRWPKRSRKRAIDACVAFVSERLNGEDGLGAIFPAMANSVMMYDALGYPESHPERALARKSVDNLLIVKDGEAYCQPCVSPIWDTVLASHAMMEVDGHAVATSVSRAMDWMKPRQILDVKGDWIVSRPQVRPGGWAFQYNNAHYPDLDDTAAVILALDRSRKNSPTVEFDEAIDRGREWIVGLQSKNGGWGAFDADNTYHYLNNIPFADHGALLDPPTADVSGRCLGALAQLGASPDEPHMKAAIAYLRNVQEKDGSWFGRWGVNYVYGTWSALAGLNAAGVAADDPTMRRAAEWLIAIQNEDGGWGEDCLSYKLDYKGYEPAPSTASQTAWAILGLMAAGETGHEAVARGIRYLQNTQEPDGLWPQDHYTGGGFPRVFYLRYHGYPKYFPLWALARYRNLMKANSRQVVHGL